MPLVKVFVRRSDGGVEDFDDLDAARQSARDGDVIGKVHRGGHVDYEAAVGSRFVPQPSGWRPRLPVDPGPDQRSSP